MDRDAGFINLSYWRKTEATVGLRWFNFGNRGGSAIRCDINDLR